MTTETNYILGDSRLELQRLIKQASFYGDLSEQAFRMAGITTGMHLLDVGCGSGDVSFLLATLVGPTGKVIGIDKSAAAIELARQRSQQAGITNVSFEVGDITDFYLSELVDGVVGRLILIHLADPVATLKRLNTLVKPGGIILFEEVNITQALSVPESPLFSTTLNKLSDTFRRAGLEPDTGSQLYSLFQRAGLSQPQMIAGSRVEGGPNSEVYSYFVETVRNMLPLMIKVGVATSQEIEIESFTERLRDEIIGLGGIIITPPLISAWVHTAWIR